MVVIRFNWNLQTVNTHWYLAYWISLQIRFMQGNLLYFMASHVQLSCKDFVVLQSLQWLTNLSNVKCCDVTTILEMLPLQAEHNFSSGMHVSRMVKMKNIQGNQLLAWAHLWTNPGSSALKSPSALFHDENQLRSYNNQCTKFIYQQFYKCNKLEDVQ